MNDVVVVDDDEMFHFLIERKSKKVQKEFVHFKNGEDALVYMKDSLPDHLILDIRMPKMDGHELLQELASFHDLSKIDIVISSSSHPPEKILELFDGFNVSFVLKENILSHPIFQ